MNKYEAMFIVNPDLSEEGRKSLFDQISDVVSKNQGTAADGAIWAERKKLFFPLKKQREGIYYHLNFSIAPTAIKEINHAYNLNDNILRVLVTKIE